MGARDAKLLDRFKSIPSDFEWTELKRLLESLGYQEGQGSGSRVKFTGADKPRIVLHKPHPGHIVKQYVLRDVRKRLMEAELI